MTPGITLKKGGFSQSLRDALEDYYKAVPVSPSCTAMKWREWADNPNVIPFRVTKDGKKLGWIVYNSAESTIEEILRDKESTDEKDLFHMVDALIARETLVAAEILKEDTDRYRWMVEYGFRPTRFFTKNNVPVIKMDLSTSILFKRLTGHKPPGAYRRKERVAVEKIPESQTYPEIKKGLENLIKKLGGLKRFVKPDQTVVIKPNIVSDHGLKDGVWQGGIVTDTRVVKALVEILLPVAGKVIVAEGSSINRSETSKMFAHYGYDQQLVSLDPRKVSLVDLNTDEQIEKSVPGGKRMHSRKIPLTLEKADAIISVPVLKIHFAAIVSLAIKHLQGAVPPLEKYMSHFFGLWQNLVNIHHLVKPKLTIIDGLVGQEDFGPISGTPKKMDLLIGGINPVAVDAVAMRIMGIDPATSPPVLLASLQGMGPIEPRLIEVIGPDIQDVMSPFQQPEIDLTGGKDITIHGESACPGCRGYLHFVLTKLRRPDPKDTSRLLIDRPFEKKVNIFLGPTHDREINREEHNIFLGICQLHNAHQGTHLPGCPPHAEVIVNGLFGLFPDVEKPKYANESEEKKLGEMLHHILTMA
ncbi:DUF362 domain-containing protein [Syntrophorhabdus aromaticivorans]|jgi:uncharacterized protein (DUF362 family)|uniref:DUF362 domain-containing protein n=1 Tax=Syntrophorhabdus aromaticivorans TaxID=328301 RepID=UPI00041E504B|nr:DUF362 domain-containing protein [Syntrophorhabdus aromaticivorans]